MNPRCIWRGPRVVATETGFNEGNRRAALFAYSLLDAVAAGAGAALIFSYYPITRKNHVQNEINMFLEQKTDGKVTGTGTITMETGRLGGVLISTDGTNAAAVILKKDDANGEIGFDISTKQPVWIGAPIKIDPTGADSHSAVLYYDISGTGASAMLYEYIP